ncbi:MAG: ABC transporter substrate-binding protein [Deltaproteobacteria bacterium]|nr:ABC transporter substrate-binding protein [Deltaproteobacteria bacterium]
MRWNKFICLVVFAVGLSAAAAVAVHPSMPVQTPIESIKELDRQADSYRVGKNLTAADRAYNQQLKQKILRGTFDLRELARLALDKYWNQRTPKEQNEFVELLTNLLEERSVFSKERAAEKGGRSYSIHYQGQKYLNKDKTLALARSVIRLKKRNIKIELDYKLKKEGNEWKIYDVIMDEASLVDNYRYSFGNIIKKQGYPELVRRMQNKLKEFQSKRSSEPS